jgi:endonuclease/exonuclease/phosphatase family metal-dependent hydrolase
VRRSLAAFLIITGCWDWTPVFAAAPTAPPLRVLTFNVAGIPLAHARWPRRRAEIARLLRQSPYDIVALQEAWLDSDVATLHHESGFPNLARLGSSGIAGNGLAILTRYSVVHTAGVVFPLKPAALAELRRGESISSKGVIMARLRTPAGELDVYNTHFTSDYPGLDHRLFRLAQAFEVYDMVRLNSQGRAFIVLGDLNCGPGDPEFDLILDLLGLEDTCAGGPGRQPCGATHDGDGGRVDHVLVPAGSAVPVRSRIALRSEGPEPLSDHSGVESEIPAARLRPARTAAARAAALGALEKRLRSELPAMRSELKARSWIPAWGFLHKLRYDRLLAGLEALAGRVETESIAAARDAADGATSKMRHSRH